MAVIQLFDPSVQGFNSTQKVYREGIELEKGVVITEDFLDKNQDFLSDTWNLFTVYPDVYLDLIKPADSNFDLFPYQRVFLRACMRYRNVFFCATRAAAKTFLTVLAKILQCIFVPGHKTFILAPNKSQAAKISSQKIDEILNIWPLLNGEIEKYNKGKDYCDLYFKNGSKFSIAAALDSDRGTRNHSGMFDETRDLDGEMLQEVVIPQLNVSRRMPNGLVNPYESVNQQCIFTSSAGAKSSYAYDQLIEILKGAIINPYENFVMGVDYRIPLKHRLLDPKFIQNLKYSGSYNETTFAVEYSGVWLGSSSDSWFDYDRIQRYRKIKNPELNQKYREDPKVFYLLSVDVGRLSDQTPILTWRINERDNRLYSTLVNIEVIGRTAESKKFDQQAIDIKKRIATYHPREVVIDCNGLGIGLADEMIKTQVDDQGIEWPAYGFFNNDDYRKIQPPNAPQILYSLKANGPLNSKIHSNVYTRLTSGMIRFLISEQEARAALLATKVGQKMTTEDRIKRLMPHELTTKLFDEMFNLRVKKNGLDIVLEQINTHYPKDKFSAFEYGQWRIKELEDEIQKRVARRSKIANRQLVFFTGGGR